MSCGDRAWCSIDQTQKAIAQELLRAIAFFWATWANSGPLGPAQGRLGQAVRIVPQERSPLNRKAIASGALRAIAKPVYKPGFFRVLAVLKKPQTSIKFPPLGGVAA